MVLRRTFFLSCFVVTFIFAFILFFFQLLRCVAHLNRLTLRVGKQLIEYLCTM